MKYSTIDHALGSSSDRYFGTGHRRSTYRFTPTRVDGEHVDGLCAIDHSGVWSAKAKGSPARHLSTLDALSLAGLAVDAAFENDRQTVSALFVTAATIKAGRTAVEDLSRVPLEARLARRDPDGAFACTIRVGTLTVGLRAQPIAAARVADTCDAGPSFFAEHLRHRVQHISDIDCDDSRLHARLGALAGVQPDQYRGLQSAHADFFSAPEAVVCLAQLGQTLAYEFDGISRAESDVFWLRRLSVELHEPRLRLGQLTDVRVDVIKSVQLTIEGKNWRSMRLSADGCALTATADVAHVLPEQRVRR